MSTLTVKVSDEILESIAAEAKRRRITKTRVIRERLKHSTKPSMWDLMKDLVVDDPNSPTDLSTNKRRMDGYGRNNPR